MREREIDGRLQIIAAMRLFKFSRLIQWDQLPAKFNAVPHDSFESDWREVDPVCGRLICWINFSAGAEFLAKGVCLLRDVDVREDKKGAVNFGTLGILYQVKLRQLFTVVDAPERERKLIVDGYQHLANEIRNRDAHAYVPNVRDSHFHDVSDRFVPCFNLLTSWLAGGPQAINRLMEGSQEFIASLA
jgi:hypothetical protein